MTRYRRIVCVLGTVLASSAALVGSINYLTLQHPLRHVLRGDPRNRGISARAHYDRYLLPSTLVLDLRSVSGANSQADVFRVLLQYAESQKEREFKRVLLAHRGKAKFMLKGSYFAQLGSEYDTQNPVYTMRTFCENLYNLDGSPAYGTWTGGLIGVLGKQMDDFGDFHKRWYFNDMLQE